MAEVLVLVEHADGEVKKVTSELLTLARRLGEPSAVLVGTGSDAAKAGARRVRRGEGLRRRGAEISSITSSRRRPRCWPSSWPTQSPGRGAHRLARAEGKEVAGRLAIKTGSRRHHRRGRRRRRGRPAAPSSRSSAASTVVQSKVTTGTPIITVRPNSVAARGGRRRRGRASRRRGRALRRGEAARSHRPRGRGEGRPPGAVRGRDRGLRRPRRRLGRELRGHRGAGRLARRRRRRLAGGDRRRLVPAPVPGRPDRQDRLAAALHRGRHLRRHPAPGRHADLEDDRRDQQGPRGPDLRAGRLRRRRRPAPGRARSSPRRSRRKG